MSSASKSTIRVASHKRRAYTRADGTRVKATIVKSHRRADLGLPGKGPKTLPPIQHPIPGYRASDSAAARQKTLDRVPPVKKLKVARQLQLLANYTRRSQPANAKKYKSDADYLFRKHKK